MSRPEPGQHRAENLFLPAGDISAGIGLFADVRDSGKDLVAAHADHSADVIDFDGDAVFSQRLRP